MNFFHASVLGLIEGVTEFLPISSTGHLILAGKLLQLPGTEFLKSFDIIIQLGAILSVVVAYWRRFLMDREVLKRIIVAFIPTGIIGLAVHGIVKHYLFGNERVVLWSLLLGGIILIVFELLHHEKQQDVADMKHMSYAQAVGIGLFQSIAVIPGVSRSAATIVGGMFLGLKRRTIVEFSFLLAVPTMAAATGLDLVKSASSFSLDQFGLLAVGFVISFIAALASIKLLLAFVKNHTFISFGVYRIVVAVLFGVV